MVGSHQRDPEAGSRFRVWVYIQCEVLPSRSGTAHWRPHQVKSVERIVWPLLIPVIYQASCFLLGPVFVLKPNCVLSSLSLNPQETRYVQTHHHCSKNLTTNRAMVCLLTALILFSSDISCVSSWGRTLCVVFFPVLLSLFPCSAPTLPSQSLESMTQRSTERTMWRIWA